MTDKITDTFYNLYVYHLLLDKIEFDFEKKRLVFFLAEFDNLTEEYVELKLTFEGVFSFYSRYPDDVELDWPSCYTVSCEKTSENRYVVSWVLLLQDQPLWKINLGFTGLEVSGGLSPEALAHREGFLRKMRAE